MEGITEEEARFISMEALQQNMVQIDLVRTFMRLVITTLVCLILLAIITILLNRRVMYVYVVSIVGGIVAGILGLTGMKGLVCFALTYIVIALSLVSKMSMNVVQFTNGSLTKLLLADLQKNGLSFTLFWTLTYALIYIY
jgi:hypothetical protein